MCSLIANVVTFGSTRSALLVSAALMVVPAQAFAQSADNTDEESTEIIVTGLRASIERSLDAKKKAVNVEDVITAEDIGKFPDTNVAEALQRIPSVTIDRSELGEGRTINLRGLGVGFTRTEINGGFAINGLDLGVVAPELITRISVEKSSQASSVEGGLAGTVKLETVKPLDSPDLRLVGVVGATIGQKAKTSPRMFGLISKNWDDRFGVALGVAYSKIDFRTNEIAYGPWVPFRRIANAATLATAPPALLDAVTPRTSAYYSYIERRDNIGGIFAVQAAPDDGFKLTADFIYVEANGARTDDRPDIPIEGNNSAPTNFTIEDGVVTSATFSGVQNRVGTSYRPQFQRVMQGTLRGEIELSDRFTIRPAVSYAERKERSELQLFSFAINNTTVSYAIDGRVPNFMSTATDFISNPEDFGFNVFIFDRFRQRTRELMGKLDAQYDLDDSGDFNVLAGARLTRRTTGRIGEFAGIFQGSPLLTPASPSLAGVATTRPFYVGGSPPQTPDRILAVDRRLARQFFYPNVTDPFIAPEFFPFLPGNAARSFEVGEDTIAAYGQVNAAFGDLALNAGIRWVQTKTDTSGSRFVDDGVLPVNNRGKSESWLPAFNARYSITPDMVVRAALTRSLTRPDLDALTPTEFVNSGPRTGTRGNPNLLPYTADQLDLSYEWYFHQGALFNLGFFHKRIKNLITQETVFEQATFPDQITGLPTTETIAFTQPTNGNSARVTGYEVGIQSPFYFLPGVLNRFGGILNYTRADNEARTRAANGVVTKSDLPGLSKNAYNAVLYYEHEGWDARLAYAWRDDYRRADPVGAQFGAVRYVRGFGQLDFSMTIPIAERFQLSADVTNLLDKQRKEYILTDTGAKPPANVIEQERRVILTARYIF